MINLIPIGYLNEACGLSMNADEKKYSMCLKIAQDLLDEILGGQFYDEIVTQYNDDTLTQDNDSLYDPYIKDFLAWATYFEYQKFSNLDPTPTGIREFRDDNSSIISEGNKAVFEKHLNEKMQYYKGKLITFIQKQKANDGTKYPLYIGTCNDNFGFAITSVHKGSDVMFKIDKATNSNE